MFTVNGLPVHILLVHAVVVLLPLSALVLAATALWPAVRRRLAGPNVLLSLAVVASVPLTTSAGEWLQARVPATDLVHEHAELGDTAVWYAIPVAVLALIVWWRQRESRSTVENPRRRTYLAPLSPVVTAVVVVAALATAGAGVYGMYRIGDSGARAAWTGSYSSSAVTP
ncbi:hypothetical protein JIG36_12030 [Actinoplanes sp. LDG1-06]|uniref:DUF2231 domain-containing protein n=1 Tax=Paractinoplanes ovalisporus TaxID=2810368 RepID=A0ABS2A8X5_9ACTN|nr:DUF2231 domain-containing protein [Actinoplanes ovalisporus]MBM2616286.1 hypothetical protein [Actinoplanes ovalisporus]